MRHGDAITGSQSGVRCSWRRAVLGARGGGGGVDIYISGVLLNTTCRVQLVEYNCELARVRTLCVTLSTLKTQLPLAFLLNSYHNYHKSYIIDIVWQEKPALLQRSIRAVYPRTLPLSGRLLYMCMCRKRTCKRRATRVRARQSSTLLSTQAHGALSIPAHGCPRSSRGIVGVRFDASPPHRLTLLA